MAISRAAGFTLIELMISIVLGMLTVLVITQVLALSEGKKRTIAMGGDAQINGALALFELKREIEMSGYGALIASDAVGCTVKYQNGGGTASSFILAPLRIESGGASAPDKLTVLHGQPSAQSTPVALTASTAAGAPEPPFATEPALGVRAGDMMIAVPDSKQWETNSPKQWCTLFSVTSAGSSGDALAINNIPHAEGGWNQSGLFPSSGYAGSTSLGDARAYLLDMGAMALRTYSVGANQNLQSTDVLTGGAAQDLFSQVVTLKALYGKDTDGDGVVDTYDTATPTTNAQWLQVLTARVAVVTRSNQYEKDFVTTTAPQWEVGSAANYGGLAVDCPNGGSSKCIALDVSHISSGAGDPLEWQHYRYKVYDTVIPLRNMLWNQDSAAP